MLQHLTLCILSTLLYVSKYANVICKVFICVLFISTLNWFVWFSCVYRVRQSTAKYIKQTTQSLVKIQNKHQPLIFHPHRIRSTYFRLRETPQNGALREGRVSSRKCSYYVKVDRAIPLTFIYFENEWKPKDYQKS